MVQEALVATVSVRLARVELVVLAARQAASNRLISSPRHIRLVRSTPSLERQARLAGRPRLVQAGVAAQVA